MKTSGKLTKTEIVLLAAALGFLLGLGLAFGAGQDREAGSYTISVQRHPQAVAEEAPAGKGAVQEEAAPRGPVNINAASPEELDVLPGIGPALAQRIIDYRAEHGPFQDLADLDGVRGIGPATLKELEGLAFAGPADGGEETEP